MEGKHLNAGLRGGLFEAKHHAGMGEAVWLFGWMVLRQTTEQGGQGLVLGGRPITYQEIHRDTGFPIRTLQRWMAALKAGGYIEIEYPRTGRRRIPLGMSVRILKAKKFGARQSSLAFPETPDVTAAPDGSPPDAVHVAARSGGESTKKHLTRVTEKLAPGWLAQAKEYAFTTWTERVRRKPTWGQKDYALLAKLLKDSPDLTLAEFQQRWMNYLDSTDPFLQRQGYSLAYFCTHFDAFLWGRLEGSADNARSGRAAREEQVRREVLAGRNPFTVNPVKADPLAVNAGGEPRLGGVNPYGVKKARAP